MVTATGDAAGRRLLVYGLGRSGGAVLRRALANGDEVSFYDRRETGADIDAALAAGARRLTSLGEAPLATGFETCVAAPGVAIDHPDLEQLRAARVEVIGEVEWVWRDVSGSYIGVTGTAGKGSVTLWLTQLLVGAGVDAVAGGNNDPALAAVARPGACHVVELSSFQLERCPTFSPDVAITLNLGEDHLDRHHTVAAYHRAKRNLVDNLTAEGTLVTNADTPRLEQWAARTAARVLRFSLEGPADAWLDRASGMLMLNGDELLHRDELAVPGDHQVANALAVALAATALNVERDGPKRPGLERIDRSTIAEQLPLFTGLPGRYAVAGRSGGITFIEDSIATRPLAVAAALTSTARPLVWLAGGHSKGADVGSLRGVVAEKVDLLVTYGASGPELAEAFGDLVPVIQSRQRDGAAALAAAVQAAVAHLESAHGGSGSVLLAPLAASFDQFKDYADRARTFRRVVAEVIERRHGNDSAPRPEGAAASAGSATGRGNGRPATDRR
ncbi:MAG TPA: UDP-N-acetylmuramoyl-L-alanine--D-glutamate ligase [Trueperaceae bacterium]|nr:UDP-N-acetylmuramoyl-L-alanine--D-glutamate ligase [Trueperaceae bacterium]